jgi:protein AroM
MKPTLHVFVIGQSPRPEVEAEIASAAPGVTVRLQGALDGMSREQIATEAAPRDDADTLFTVLPTGETTTISKAAVTARLVARLRDTAPSSEVASTSDVKRPLEHEMLEPDGCNLKLSGSSVPALLCCTGAFKGLPQRATIVQPSAVLNGLAASLLPAGTLGLFVPLPEQIETLGEMRTRPGLRTVAVPLRPLSDVATIDAAAQHMAAQKPDLVILDCMSYTRTDKARVAAILGCPILLPIAVAARVAASLLPE